MASRARLWAVQVTLLAAVSAVTIFVSACTPVSPPAQSSQGESVMTGKNSSFNKSGVEEINRSRAAFLDLSSGSLNRSDVGVQAGDTFWDVNVPVDKSIHLTIKGSQGELVADSSTIRLLADDADGQIRTISYFLAFDDVAELAQTLREDAAKTGLDSADVESFLAAAEKAPEREHTVSLNGGNALGFQLSIDVTVDTSKSG
ncbi:hypothetical protein RSal33209_2465 [Renibacterium salmoninarum ATCC 33209]|uniref:Lipoprotein n=2 Tax=Renibacterium salmoninarum TaxID=1646 RepID=A9WS62_RENSM|nr:hypothetical protein [Renibacterium salmoninarum]ABY24191.1 hypothetical protein RSal33209_2465 [Renibacterium salmoninarum ATCC 33209]